MRICLVLPPLTQVNTPYPSTAYLARHLRSQGFFCEQRDLGIELFLKVMSRSGLTAIFDELEHHDSLPDPAWTVMAQREKHLQVIEPVIAFLQGKDRGLVHRLNQSHFLPTGPRLESSREDTHFGRMNQEDKARYRATLYVKDLVDLVRSCIDAGFELNRYQHHLSAGQSDLSTLIARLEQTTLVDAWLDELAEGIEADVVGLSVPFPGNFYGALRVGRLLKERGLHVLLGGGYVNTELRDFRDPEIYRYVDALFFDDGEGPLTSWLNHLQGKGDSRHRTRTSEGDIDRNHVRPTCEKVADYQGLNLQNYLQIIDSLNPTHRLWSDGRWNKMTLAHGCYWKRCEFCDIQLDYIARYEPARVEKLLDQIEELVEETGQTGFHMVDEAAPPKIMVQLAEGLLARNLAISWWGNIRFEPAFTPDVCRLLSASGLVAVTGGLEVASDRLLEKMDKGITVDQVVRVAHAFSETEVMVHAYLMYGFPTQTQQEAVDAMEVVRQLFANGLLDSAFWHRFVLTKHSGVMRDPDRFGIDVLSPEVPSFSENDLQHRDRLEVDWAEFDEVLPLSLGHWMRGEQLERPVHRWFEGKTPRTSVAEDRVERSISDTIQTGKRWIWLGGDCLRLGSTLRVTGHEGDVQLEESESVHDWIEEVLEACLPGEEPLRRSDAVNVFPGSVEHLERTLLPLLHRAGLLEI
ncbi:MAG: radical SAM protein [Myxococcota bacterium]|nr:radical SAM protein [Myxococcota bacterium]